jgi:hypothetical protein
VSREIHLLRCKLAICHRVKTALEQRGYEMARDLCQREKTTHKTSTHKSETHFKKQTPDKPSETPRK